VNLLLLLFALIVSAAAVGAWLARRQFRYVVARRLCSTLVSVGRPLTVRYEIDNTSAKRTLVGLTIQDQYQGPASARASFVKVPAISAKGSAQVRDEIAFSRRGAYSVGPLRLVSEYPFGLIRWTQILSNTHLHEPIIVHPPIGRLRVEAQHRLGISALGEGRAPVGLREGLDECRGVRDFRDGDSPKLVHWRSTARRGSLVVRELEPATSRNVLLLVHLIAGRDAPACRRVEEVLSFASTLVYEVCRDTTLQLTLIVLGRDPSVIRGMAAPHRAGIYLRSLALAEPIFSATIQESLGRLLRPTDTRDRRLWVVTATGLGPEGDKLLAGVNFRRVSARVVLNASAGDLGSLWVEDPLPEKPGFSPSADYQEKSKRAGK
jgi:uncharacterized protein (DUF58 family)